MSTPHISRGRFFEKTNSCEKCGKKSHKMHIKSNKTANFSRKFSRIQKKS